MSDTNIVDQRVRAKPGEKRRRKSGTAAWHMSKQAVTLTVQEVMDMTEHQVHEYWVKQRWGSRETISCPHCGTIDEHIWKKQEKRWRCLACRKSFSVTSCTPFAKHQKPLKFILASALLWVNGASGMPALELRRHMGGKFVHTFVREHKFRESLMRGFNVGLLSGDVEMDGVHQSGRRSVEKRGKPQVTAAVTEATVEDKFKTLQDRLKAQSTKVADKSKEKRRATNGEKDGTYGVTLHPDRRIVICARVRSGVRGKGAKATRVGVGRTEGPVAVNAIIDQFLAVPESVLNTDMAKAYVEPGKRFVAHRSVEHAKELVGPNGENTNLGEEFARRHKRAERGVYLNIEPKYTLDYAGETAWRSDTCRMGNGGQLGHLMGITLRNGRSCFWTGYSNGKHREVEFLAGEGEVPAKASGPKKGFSTVGAKNNRPPR